MLEFALDLEEETKNKLKKILDQYSDKEVFAKNIIEYETSQLKKGIVNIQIDLKNFEKKYGLSSQDFYQKFKSGEFGDDEDYIIWAGICEILIQNKDILLKKE
jgi:hypothetical protein